LKKPVSSAHIHQWNKAWRGHWILTCASPQEFVKVSNAGATGLFSWYFMTFKTVAFPLQQNNLDLPEPHL
jgi:hypothetical protein